MSNNKKEYNEFKEFVFNNKHALQEQINGAWIVESEVDEAICFCGIPYETDEDETFTMVFEYRELCDDFKVSITDCVDGDDYRCFSNIDKAIRFLRVITGLKITWGL